MRSGAQTLMLLVAPLNVPILRALANGPKRQSEFLSESEFPAQSTLRTQLKRLAAVGAVTRHRCNAFPGALEHGLTKSGRELLLVTDTLERWLGIAPDTPIAIGTGAARAAVKALTQAWSTTMLRALAASPLSLTELDALIAPLSYPALQRRLSDLRLAGLVRALQTADRGRPYTLTDWAREGMAPLIAAALTERRGNSGGSAPIGRIEAETAILLSLPLVQLRGRQSGVCLLTIEPSTPNGRCSDVAVAVADDGISWSAPSAGRSDARLFGPPSAWLEAMAERNLENLEFNGKRALGEEILASMHRVLFGGLNQLDLDGTR